MKYTTRCNVSKLCFMCYKFTKGCMMLMFMKCSANVKAKHQGCYTCLHPQQAQQLGAVPPSPLLVLAYNTLLIRHRSSAVVIPPHHRTHIAS